jgi:CelD/BcsL family acetyltransferase involved in cellulose biosynthesis
MQGQRALRTEGELSGAAAAAVRPRASETVSTVASEPDFDLAGPEYRDLFARSDATAFQHPLWLDRFYARLAPARGAEKLLLTGRDAHGRLLFVLPMICRRKWGIALLEAADLGVSDYAAPIADRMWRSGAGLQQAIAAALPAFDLLRIRPVRAEDVAQWLRFFDAETAEQDFSAHSMTLFAPHRTWREQALSASFAKYLDRKKKRLFKSGDVRLRLLDQPGEAAVAIRAIQALRAGRFEGDPVQQDFVRGFYSEVATAGVSAGLARTYALTLDGEPLAYVFGLTHAGRFHYLLIGSDYATHGKHSPGLIAYDLIIEDWLSAGGDCFDFTIGDEPFKRDFGTSATAMYLLSRCNTPRGRLAVAAFRFRDRLRELRSNSRAAGRETATQGDKQ